MRVGDAEAITRGLKCERCGEVWQVLWLRWEHEDARKTAARSFNVHFGDASRANEEGNAGEEARWDGASKWVNVDNEVVSLELRCISRHNGIGEVALEPRGREIDQEEGQFGTVVAGQEGGRKG